MSNYLSRMLSSARRFGFYWCDGFPASLSLLEEGAKGSPQQASKLDGMFFVTGKAEDTLFQARIGRVVFERPKANLSQSSRWVLSSFSGVSWLSTISFFLPKILIKQTAYCLMSPLFESYKLITALWIVSVWMRPWRWESSPYGSVKFTGSFLMGDRDHWI